MAEIMTDWNAIKQFLDDTGLYINLNYIEYTSFYYVWVNYEDLQMSVRLERGSTEAEDFIENYSNKTKVKKTILEDGTKYVGSRGILNQKYYRKICFQGDLSTIPESKNYFSVKLFDENGDLLSKNDEREAVMTVMRFEPDFNYDAIGGEFRVLIETNEEIYVDVVGNPEIPASIGGNLGVIVNEQYINYIPILIETKEAMPLKYYEGQHTNVIEIRVSHAKGLSLPYQIKISFYYSNI